MNAWIKPELQIADFSAAMLESEIIGCSCECHGGAGAGSGT